jgi:predicted RNA-binding protein with TRAM domain
VHKVFIPLSICEVVGNQCPYLGLISDLFGLKRPRSYEKHQYKNNRFGGSKAPTTPISVGEEYIVTIEQMGKQGEGVASVKGFVILVNDTNPGDKVMVRITKVGWTFAAGEVFSPK